jgi:hypothetical protein
VYYHWPLRTVILVMLAPERYHGDSSAARKSLLRPDHLLEVDALNLRKLDDAIALRAGGVQRSHHLL